MAIGPLMLDVEGLTLTQQDRDLLADPKVGGIIYFARNFSSVEQISDLSAAIKSIRPDIMIAVDQEGGRVQRIKSPLTRIPPMQSFSKLFSKSESSTLALLRDCGWLLASELRTLGIDFSFTPVLDVDDAFCEVIANRSFSNNPLAVTAMAGALIEGLQEAGTIAVGKHFPGHGGVKGDSHHMLPVDERDLNQLGDHDLLPFMALSDTLDAVMPAHICYPRVDSEPVCFSSTWLQRILRKELAFEGVIFSDDLSMSGAVGQGSYPERAVKALNAGCDMVLVCNNREGAIEVLNTDLPNNNKQQTRLRSMLASSPIGTMEQLHESSRWQKAQTLLGALAQ